MTDKQAYLSTCLALAKLDADYAIRAAAWYEAKLPWLLVNLAAKVRQEVQRAKVAADAGAAPSIPADREHVLAQRAR